MSIADILARKRAAAATSNVDVSVEESAPQLDDLSGTPTPEASPTVSLDESFDVDQAEKHFEKIYTVYPTLTALKQSPLWPKLKLRQRIEVGKQYHEQQKLAQEPLDEERKPLAKAVEQAVRPKTLLERLMEKYPTFPALRESSDWKTLDIGTRVAITREYTKEAQKIALYAANAQRDMERLAEQEELKKAKEQRGTLNPAQAIKEQTFALNIVLNEKQQLSVDYALAGKSFVLTGAAGTGKTTACREIARAFLQRGDLGSHTFKLDGGERVTSHGIAFCSYTRRATANIRRALHRDRSLERDLSVNVVTIHRLLEYEPEFFTNPETGKDSMRFVPKRHRNRQLDTKVLVIEEASMLGLDLWEKLYDAMRVGTVLVFVGDINQLPPVFGKSIMNYALAQLPVVELTEVYRQAFDSGIIVNAHRILKGEVPINNKDTHIVEGTQKIQVPQERMARALGGMFFQLWQNKEYDPEQDIILSPWNKQPCGTNNLNDWIAQFLGEQRKAMVYEVLAGRRKLYLAVGDRVMYEKRDGIIVSIRHNASYLGKAPQPAGTDLTRFGLRKLQNDAVHEDFEAMAIGYENLNVDEVADDEKKLQASHTVTLKLDGGEEETLSAVGDFAEQVFSLGYALTVHKAQGCEWRNVYVVLHKDHTLGGFLTRELVYTACTRAREKLILIAKSFVLEKAVKQQEIKGNTLEEKIQSINSGASNIGSYPVVKRA